MSSAIDWLNDWLSKAAPTDLVFFVRYPANLADFAVTADDLLHKLKAAPMPPDVTPPPEPPPIIVPPPPPPPPVEDTLTVVASYGLTIRAQPSPTSTNKGAVAKDDVVTVSGHNPAKDAQGNVIDYAQLLRVNNLKYADTGFVARSKGSEVYLSPKP